MFERLKKQIVIKEKTVYVEVENKKRYKDLVVLVTGATGSLGRAISERFAIEGATVILTGRNVEALLKMKEGLQKNAATVDFQQMDVTDEISINSAIEQIVNKYQKIDILINNAGFSARAEKEPLHLQKIEHIDTLLDTNLRGAILTSRKVVEYMRNSMQGRIIHISSIVGIQGKNKHAEYAAAKAGLIGLAKSQAIELGQYGITVNCVSPGLVPREDASAEKLARFEKMNRLSSICVPEDISNAVAFLCSNEARYVTGQNLIVDGGRSLGLYGD